MRSDPWESRGGVLPGKLEIGIDAEHLERRTATGIAWVCREQVGNGRLIHLMCSALTIRVCRLLSRATWTQGSFSAEGSHGRAPRALRALIAA